MPRVYHKADRWSDHLYARIITWQKKKSAPFHLLWGRRSLFGNSPGIGFSRSSRLRAGQLSQSASIRTPMAGFSFVVTANKTA